jgi:Ca-activated chloride channel family protein
VTGFEFDNNDYWWIWLILLAVLGSMIYAWYNLNKTFTKIFYSTAVAKVFSALDLKKWKIIYGLQALSLLTLIISLYNPKLGKETITVKASGADVYFALDISNSMYAQDLAPNRLERAKRLCKNIASQLNGNRIGLITFAGGAYLNMPISSDIATAINMIIAANPEQSLNQGTALGDAISLGIKTFDENSTKNKVMIIVTDGETHDDNTLDEVKKAYEQGVTLIPIGIGTEGGGQIRTPDGNFVYDEDNNAVITRLNPKIIKQLSKDNLSFILKDNDADITKTIITKIKNLSGGALKTSSYDQKKSMFQYPLALGLTLFLASLFVPLFKKQNL